MATMATMPASTAAASGPAVAGSFYCSTSGTTFSDKEAYLEHMRSDFHRYNLKRKVAGLPPVTREWFESRRDLLLASSAAAAAKPVGAQMWKDPLTKRTFSSEGAYLSFTRSKKYQDLVKKSGAPAPEPVTFFKAPQEQQQQQEEARDAGADAKAFASAYTKASGKVMPGVQEEDEEEGSDGWETASDEGDAAAAAAAATADGPSPAGRAAAEGEGAAAADGAEEEEWEKWDVCRSLFDNHMSDSLDANLEYMYKNFGFYIPDSEYLTDPAGLVQYLGAKLQYGRVPLYTRGDDANCRQFRSLRAVQSHMVDTCQCRMAYDDNEDEYSQFYDYGPDEEEEGKDLALSNLPAAAVVMGGFELMIPGDNGQGGKVLGTREFARYYRQRHRLADTRQSVMVNSVQARYRSLGITLIDSHRTLEAKKQTQKTYNDLYWENKKEVKRLVFSNFVKQLGKGVGREY